MSKNIHGFHNRAWATFSPNGEYYAWFDMTEGLRTLHFDRCSGSFSEPYDWVPVDTAIAYNGYGGIAGISFSPNSRYLYVNSTYNLYQLDMNSADPGANAVLIDSIDYLTWVQQVGYPPQGRYWATQALGPDGQTYLLADADTKMGVIHHPDLPGIACQFQNRAFPTQGFHEVPNHPHYRLGPIDGSSCDTLGLDAHPEFWWVEPWRSVPEDTGTVAMEVQVQHPSADTLRVEVYPLPDTGATNGLDYSQIMPFILEFPPGVTTQSFDVHVIDDVLVENDEEAVFLLRNPSADAIVPAWYASLRIRDNDAIGVGSIEDGKTGIKIWPNPANDLLHLQLLHPSQGNGIIILRDVLGRTAMKVNAQGNVAAINVGQLPHGVYVVEWRDGDGAVYVERVVLR